MKSFWKLLTGSANEFCISNVSQLAFILIFFCSAVSIAQTDPDKRTEAAARPNVLWLTAEDIGPHLGCYGDAVARTPNLDALAAKGMSYQNAWSNYPCLLYTSPSPRD